MASSLEYGTWCCYGRGFKRLVDGGTEICEVCRPMREAAMRGINFTPVAQVDRHPGNYNALVLFFPRPPSVADMVRIRSLLRAVPERATPAGAPSPLALAAQRVLAASAKACAGCVVSRWAGQENGRGEEFGVEFDAALVDLRAALAHESAGAAP